MDKKQPKYSGTWIVLALFACWPLAVWMVLANAWEDSK